MSWVQSVTYMSGSDTGRTREFWSGRRDSNPRPQLGKVPNGLAIHLRGIAQAHGVKTLGLQVGVPPQHFPILVAGDERDLFD
jgi:hypothetical protein